MSSSEMSTRSSPSLDGMAPSPRTDGDRRGIHRTHSDQYPEVERAQPSGRNSRRERRLSQEDEAGPSTRDVNTGTAPLIWQDAVRNNLSRTTTSLEGPEVRTSTDVDRKRRLTNSAAHNMARSRTVSGGFHNSKPRRSTFEQDASLGEYRPAQPTHPLAQHRPRQSPTGPESRSRRNERPRLAVADRHISATREVVLPSWQADSEVSRCPICSREFTFWFRKHHCRKCGRVVCANCSPHRITIPRQFIVRPAEVASRASTACTRNPPVTPESAGPAPCSLQQGLGGGDEVRLCNPCVPDPQPSPQASMDLVEFLRHGSSRGELEDPFGHPHHHSRNTANTGHHYAHQPSPSREARELRRQRGRGMIFQPDNGSLNAVRTEAEEIPDESLPAYGNFNYTLVPNYGRPGRPPHYHPSPAPTSSPPDYASPEADSSTINNRGALPQGSARSHRSVRNFVPAHGRYSSMDALTRPVPPRYNRPRVRSLLDTDLASTRSQPFFGFSAPRPPNLLREEDVCPICRYGLPARGADGDETVREAHIRECIASRDQSAGATSPLSQSSMHLPPSSPVHMLPFAASEKDCLGEEDTRQECSICFVEYEVGDQLARLECLCKFHRSCIVEWFSRKQECPLHKLA